MLILPIPKTASISSQMSRPLWLTLPLLGLLCGTRVSQCQCMNDSRALKRHLFQTQGYDRTTRPIVNQSHPVRVQMSLGVYLVFDLDEVSQTLQLAGFLDITWRDEALTWDPNQFGGLESEFFPQDDVWKPDVSLKNSVQDFKALGDSALNVHVRYDGLMRWQPYHLFSSYCSIDITRYPFDEQSCVLTFMTWGYDKEHIVIEGPSSEYGAVTLEFMQQNSEWNITKVSCASTDKPKPMMFFYLTLKRKPRTVILNIILPLFILSFLNVSVFVLPCNSGERSGFAVTIFLAFVLYCTLISSSLPANSDSVCYLANYIITQVVQSAVVTILSLFSVRLCINKTPFPGWFVDAVAFCQQRKLRRDVTVPYPADDLENVRCTGSQVSVLTPPGGGIIQGQKVNVTKKKIPSRDDLERIFDVVMLFLFTTLSVVAALAFYFTAA